MVPLPFVDREDAARQLVPALSHLRGRDLLVLAIPRGAVPMGRVLADALGAELDVVLVRKLGAPGHSEYAIGAVDEAGHVTLNRLAGASGADDDYLRREAQAQLGLIGERRRRYRDGVAPARVRGRTVIVVDDGLATGATMAAALRAVREAQPAHLVCAVPVGARRSLAEVAPLADETVCLATPDPFEAVGLHYRRFDQVDDDEVVRALRQS